MKREDNMKQEKKRQDEEMSHCEELKTLVRKECGSLKKTPQKRKRTVTPQTLTEHQQKYLVSHTSL